MNTKLVWILKENNDFPFAQAYTALLFNFTPTAFIIPLQYINIYLPKRYFLRTTFIKTRNYREISTATRNKEPTYPPYQPPRKKCARKKLAKDTEWQVVINE